MRTSGELTVRSRVCGALVERGSCVFHVVLSIRIRIYWMAIFVRGDGGWFVEID